MSRTENSIKNLTYSIIFRLLTLLVSFVSRKIFIDILSVEYLGLDGTFSSILTMLSLAELGVGSAIIYSMYKPLANGDEKLIVSLMDLYRRIYRVIGVVVAVIGAAITPFLPVFIKDLPDIPNIYLIYLMFVANSALSYFFVYKQSLINADQKQYIVTSYSYRIRMVTLVVSTIVLMLTREYIVYLSIQIASTMLTNLLLAKKADRLFPYLKAREIPKLPPEEKQQIAKNIKAMIAHKVGTVVVFGTDNLLIAYFVGAISVGLYSNYLMITSSLKSIISSAFSAMTASVGNLCAAEDKRYAAQVYWRVNLFGSWIYGFSAICLFVLLNPFISLWIGKDFVFSLPIVFLIVLNFYVTGMRQATLTFREAMGLYWYDRHKPFFESAVNLIVSVILAINYGIVGVLIGTFVSTMTTCFWIEPLVLFKYGLESSVKPFFLKYTAHTTLVAVAGAVTWYACALLPNFGLLAFVGKMAICAIVPNLFLYCSTERRSRTDTLRLCY